MEIPGGAAAVCFIIAIAVFGISLMEVFLMADEEGEEERAGYRNCHNEPGS